MYTHLELIWVCVRGAYKCVQHSKSHFEKKESTRLVKKIESDFKSPKNKQMAKMHF
jgi:hypothetical protein